MMRLTFSILFVLAVFLAGCSARVQPFVPTVTENVETDASPDGVTENGETDTSPEEVSEIMEPICKIFIDARVWTQGEDSSGAFSPDGRYLAVFEAVTPRNVALFDLNTGKNIKRFQGNHSEIKKGAVAFSPDSRRFAFRNHDNVIVWDIVEDKAVCYIPLSQNRFGGTAAVYSLRFSDDGKTLSGVVGPVGFVWDIEAQGTVIKTVSRSTPGRGIFYCYPDLSRAIVYTDQTRKHEFRDLTSGQNIERFTNFCFLSHYYGPSVKNLSRMAFSDDDQYFALDNNILEHNLGNHLLVWDAPTGSDICTIPLAYKLTAFTFLPKSRVLVTACDPDPQIPFGVRPNPHVPKTTPMRKPVPKTPSRAVIEFWDIDHLIWHKEKANLFPRKIKTCYLEGEDDIHFMAASPDGKLLYMRSGKPIVERGSTLNIANGYIFSLDPNEKPELPTEIRLDDQAIVRLTN